MSLLYSTKYPAYCKLPDLPGIHIAPHRVGNGRVWGKPILINFLEKLSAEWSARHWDHPFYVGDLSPEGGSGKLQDHASHQGGLDVDIYVVTQNGLPPPGYGWIAWNSKDYDQALTKELAQIIMSLTHGPCIFLDKFFFNDREVLTSVPGITRWPNHDDHFHIRLKPEFH